MRELDEQPDLSRRVGTALELIPDEEGEEKLRPTLVWQVMEMLGHLKPVDLTTGELMAMCAILSPAHSRWLTLTGHPAGKVFPTRGRSPVLGKILSLVPGDGRG